jgi:predicted alpha/beta-hydrolase family hydrolase
MVESAAALARRGVTVVTFNFPYTEQRRKVPDKQPVLEQCYSRVIETVAERYAALPLFIGGKSMGGRIASHVATGSASIRGLVFFGYPLHPPGKPEQRRDRHLPAITAPMLFVQGARDTFGTPEEFEPVLKALTAPCVFHTVERGDHSLKVTRNAAAQKQIMDGIYDQIASWIAGVIARTA